MRVDIRGAVVAFASVLSLALLASCGTGNEPTGDGSGISLGTPAPTSVTSTSPPVPTSVSVPATAAATSVAPTVTSSAIATSAVPVQPGLPPTRPARTPVPTIASTQSAVIPAPTVSATNAPTMVPTVAPTPVETPATASSQPQPLRAMGFERVFRWYSPSRPTHLEEARDGSGRIYVSEQGGKLIEVTGDPTSQTGGARTVLDITNLVTGRAREEGFLGFALHPDSPSNGHLYAYYSAANPRRSVISEFTLQQNGLIDPDSERIVMQVSQPNENHNGGMLAFGPDGYLYIGLGDGGGAGDRSNNAQNTSNVLGTILRIDVDSPGLAYASPPDNPFVGEAAAAPEIWAYGLRNPWRFTFDRETGDLWAGDVGQNRIEEIDLIVRGGNYGWRLKEGPDCFNPSSGCEQQANGDLIEPIASYGRGFGCSVSGGYVYRGTRLPSLFGAYVYADFCSGIVWALRHSDGEVTEQMMLADTNHQVPAFGQTLDGEVYMLTYSPGIFRFVER